MQDLKQPALFFAIGLGAYSYYVRDTNYLYAAIGMLFLYFFLEIYPALSKIKRFSRAELTTIDKMNGIEFEEYIQFLLEKLEYKKVRTTKRYGDQGIDLIAKKEDTTIGIQCKRWNKKVGNKAVQEVHAGIGYYKLDKGIVVTNNYFTNSAKELAERLDVELWNRNKLVRMLEELAKTEN